MKVANTNTLTNKETITLNEDVALHDFKNSLLIVSLLINAFIFTTWLTLQVTDQYNTAVIRALFG